LEEYVISGKPYYNTGAASLATFLHLTLGGLLPADTRRRFGGIFRERQDDRPSKKTCIMYKKMSLGTARYRIANDRLAIDGIHIIMRIAVFLREDSIRKEEENRQGQQQGAPHKTL